ncbi:hypothetical protein QDQ60_02355 [Klebsiella aerogenes]|uniref:hypothetical protein n=1 Tax=Klebsiella aerogenes TaxID=548 RepID=UPI0033486F5C
MDAWIGSMIGGAVGAVIGHITNHCIGWYKENKQSSPERKFICAELVFLLEEYAKKCAEISEDYGENTRELGDAEPAVTPPNLLDYSSVKGNWRSLSSDIMYRLCSLPAEQKDAQKHISASLEYVATPPNYPEYFETRQYHYSILGLKAAQIASDIRKQNNFPDGDLYRWEIPAMTSKIKALEKKATKGRCV